jgi:hypothetical protein
LKKRGSNHKHKISLQNSLCDFIQHLRIRDIFGKYTGPAVAGCKSVKIGGSLAAASAGVEPRARFDRRQIRCNSGVNQV